MPQSGQGKDNQYIEYHSCHPLTIAPQRKIYIVSEPRLQRNMPTSPEFFDIFGKIRKPEIF